MCSFVYKINHPTKDTLIKRPEYILCTCSSAPRGSTIVLMVVKLLYCIHLIVQHSIWPTAAAQVLSYLDHIAHHYQLQCTCAILYPLNVNFLWVRYIRTVHVYITVLIHWPVIQHSTPHTHYHCVGHAYPISELHTTHTHIQSEQAGESAGGPAVWTAWAGPHTPPPPLQLLHLPGAHLHTRCGEATIRTWLNFKRLPRTHLDNTKLKKWSVYKLTQNNVFCPRNVINHAPKF